MATKKRAALTGEALVAMRKKSGLNQLEFWQRFGITQSGGSRYETGRALPKPAKILIALYLSGRITDADLAAARKAAGVPVTATAV
jgi:transcriptional regulator with XRE-family HTH domain